MPTLHAADENGTARRRRIVLLGRNSHIAQHVYLAAKARAEEAVWLSSEDELADIARDTDVVINFRITAAYRSSLYAEANDRDLSAARSAQGAGARFVMLSTRKVYAAGQLWGAREDGVVHGDGTFYGDNKTASEGRISGICGSSVLILRLSNVFGFEYSAEKRRDTFFGRMLSSLKDDGAIRFDMSAATRRDFIPVTRCAEAIVYGAVEGLSGIYNIGCGFPLACGDLANSLMEGYGGGSLIAASDKCVDEFYLDITKWKKCCENWDVSLDEIRNYCFALGQRLRNA